MSVDRRTVLSIITSSVVFSSGCLDFSNLFPEEEEEENIERVGDIPDFEVDHGTSEEIILLRNQPQRFSEIIEGDEIEVGIFLGNSGGEPVTGEVSIEVVLQNGQEHSQSDTILIEELPSGAARFFVTGPFTMVASGEWEVLANSGIDRTHQEYDPTISARPRE